MNKESKKLTWAVGLVAGLGVLSIAYAALSSTLNIKGENASVNIGYVHFQNTTENPSGVVGIGSNNPDYITSDGKSNITAREKAGDTGKGMITSSDFLSKDWAKALAVPGTLSLETSEGGKTNDTIKVTGTQLNDYGSFVVYKLGIINESSNNMALTALDTANINVTDGSLSTDNIEIGLYKACDTDSFATPCVDDNKLRTVGKDGFTSEIIDKDAQRYLAPNGTTTWYLRVGFKNYGETNNTSGTTKFNFSITPRWEADSVS